MRRLLLGLAVLVLAVSQASFPVLADGVAFDMQSGGASIGTLIVCRDGRAITGTIEIDGRVICGPATFERTGRRQGQLVCEDGTVFTVGQIPGTTTLGFDLRGLTGALRRLR